MSAFGELHIGHVWDGNLWIPKISCFLAFKRAIFCEYVIVGLDHNLLDNSLSISGFIVHLEMFGNLCVIILRFLSRSCFLRYVSRHLTGPLSCLLAGPGHSSL